MKKRMVIAIAALVVVFGGIFGWKAFIGYQTGKYFASFQPPPVTISTGVATLEHWQPRVEAVGSLAAVHGVDVAAEVAGVVKEIRFKSGDTVNQGDVLVQLDDAAEQAELPGLRARTRQAEQNLARAKQLREQGLVAQEALDTAQSEYDQARSTLRAREVTIEKKAVRAPFDGKLGIRQVNIGEYVQPSATIVTLQSLSPLYVNFTLPQQQLGRVEPGQSLSIVTDAFADAFVGSISAVSPRIDPSSRNFAVQGEVANENEKLRSGMFVEISVETGSEVARVTVPLTAVTYSLYGDSVYVVTKPKDGDLPVAEQRFVRTGEERDGRVAIIEGVQVDDTVVTAGQLKLRDGARLNIDNEVALQD